MRLGSVGAFATRVHESEWLTATEAAHHLRVKPRTILLWSRQGHIKGYRLSGTKRCVWRFKREDLDAALTAPDSRAVIESAVSSAGPAGPEAA
jgi:excisionase family DNA binding protein